MDRDAIIAILALLFMFAAGFFCGYHLGADVAERKRERPPDPPDFGAAA